MDGREHRGGDGNAANQTDLAVERRKEKAAKEQLLNQWRYQYSEQAEHISGIGVFQELINRHGGGGPLVQQNTQNFSDSSQQHTTQQRYNDPLALGRVPADGRSKIARTLFFYQQDHHSQQQAVRFGL